MNHYWSVYKKFLSTCFGQASSFRTHFFLLILMDLVFYFSTLASVSFIFDHVDKIGVWNRDQLLFFTIFMLSIDQLHMTLISESFWRFSMEIRTGGLDFILLRPLHSLFIVFFRYFRPSSMLNIFVTAPLLIYYGQKVNLLWWQFALLPLFIVFGLALLVIMEMILSCLMFWMVEGMGINFLRMELQKVSRWPDFVYARFLRRFFTVICPVLVIGSSPVKFLISNELTPLLGLFVIFPLIFVLKYAWNKGLNQYESASS